MSTDQAPAGGTLDHAYTEVGAVAIARHTGPGTVCCPTCGEPSWRIGTDVQEVAPVLDSVRRHGERYLERVFTGSEVDDSRGADPMWTWGAIASLAGRFAAKEAVLKALRPRAGVRWTQVEVVRRPGGWSALQLHDGAGCLAARAGLTAWSLSFAHDGAFAVATVVARHECQQATRTQGADDGGDHGHDHP